MITIMRRYSKALRVGLLAVIVAFVLTSVYVGSMSGGARNRGDAVATVNGESIPVERYQRRDPAYLAPYPRGYRARFSPTLAEHPGPPPPGGDELRRGAGGARRG